MQVRENLECTCRKQLNIVQGEPINHIIRSKQHWRRPKKYVDIYGHSFSIDVESRTDALYLQFEIEPVKRLDLRR